jgi:hypothetical protein
MAQNVTQYQLLISCPGDVVDELKIINEVVEQFNESFSETLGVMIQSRHWSKSSYAASGGKPQNILNEQFVKKCDLAVAVFSTRFGTPTDEYSSGTEEEIETMLAADKQVFMYFSNVDIPRDKIDSEQLTKIKAFREKYKNSGLYFTYDNTTEFKELFYAHLTKHFLSLKAVNEVKSIKSPNLRIVAIQGKNLKDGFTPQYFKLDYISSTKMIDEIKELCKEICDYKIINAHEVNVFSGLMLGSGSPVVIDDSTKENITSIVNYLEINISTDFFNLGGLSGFMMGTMYQSINGSVEEKEKYHKINLLESKINTLIGWTPFENIYEKLNCIRLAIENNGTTFDEDIEITLSFSKNTFIQPKDMPFVEAFDKTSIETDLSDLFDIETTVSYNSYDSTLKPGAHYYEPEYTNSIYNLYQSDENRFRDALDTAFADYDFFAEEDTEYVRINFDYLKHNTVAAFPTVLFVKDGCDSIKYVIKSKHFETPIEGEIKSCVIK